MRTMTVPTYEGTEVVTGHELKRFFVHRTLKHLSGFDPETWTVTHKATGRAIARSFRKRLTALAFAKKLDGYPGFDDLPVEIPREGLPKEQFQELREFVKNALQEVA